MVKIFNYLTLFFALGVLFTSCQDDQIDTVPVGIETKTSGQSRSIYATVTNLVEDGIGSKVAIDSLAFTWEIGDKLTISKYPTFDESVTEQADVYFKQATFTSDGNGKTVSFSGGSELDNTTEYPANYAYAVYSQNDVKSDSFYFWRPNAPTRERLFYLLETPMMQDHQYLDAAQNLDPESIGKYAVMYGMTTGLWLDATELNKSAFEMNHLMSFVDFTITGLYDTVKVNSIDLSSDVNFCSWVNYQAKRDSVDRAHLMADSKDEDEGTTITVNLLSHDGTKGVYPINGKLKVRVALRYVEPTDRPTWTMRLHDHNNKLLYTGVKEITRYCEPGFLYSVSMIVTPPVNIIHHDIKVDIIDGTADTEQPANPLAHSFDGDNNTYYQSKGTTNIDATTGLFVTPVDVDYFLDPQGEDVNYMVYSPQGISGNIRQFEVFVRRVGQTVFETASVGGALFEGLTPSRYRFNTTLTGVTGIRIRVLLAASKGQAQGKRAPVSCKEIEFYKFNPENFNPFSLFTDETCSVLKTGIALADINACTDEFYKGIATKMFNNTYDREFRIQEYKAWMDPVTDRARNKSNKPHSELDNPTGIVAVQGEELIVLAGDLHGYTLRIQIQNLDRPSGDGYGWGSAYPITKGVNKIMPRNGGLIYVMYHSDNPETLPPIKLHFATGNVNGYYDSQKHTEPGDWRRLLDAATDKYFDVLGKYSHLTFETQQFRDDTPDGKELMGIYDSIAYEQQWFMGLVKYNRMFKNRFYLHVVYKSFMYVASYRTAYQNTVITSRGLCIPWKLRNNVWGVAHEIGHANQTIGWKGVGEVTNNILSAHVKTVFTGTGLDDKTYNKATTLLANNPDWSFQDMSAVDKNLWSQLVPFWQLYLYFVEVEGQPDFYKDLYEYWRNNPEKSTQGEIQLDFFRRVCHISGYDMTEFFEYWRFLTPMSTMINNMQITQQQIDDLKAEIAAENYIQPQADVWLIRESNVDTYK